jgi:hypothetical protein
MRSYLITTFGGCLDCINDHSITRWSKRCLSGIPMEYVEAYGSRAGFVHPCDGLILWVLSVTVASTKLTSMWLGHMNALSWERVKKFVGNNTEHDIEISKILDKLSIMKKGNMNRRLWINYDIRGVHRGQHGFPDPVVDHWSERSLDHVWSAPDTS